MCSKPANPLTERRKFWPATDEVRQHAQRFVESAEPTGASNHFLALRSALLYQPDELFFVTDGGDPKLGDAELQNIAELNQGHSRLHCIELASDITSSQRLRKLASQNGGDYKRIVAGQPEDAATLQATLPLRNGDTDRSRDAPHELRWAKLTYLVNKLETTALFGREQPYDAITELGEMGKKQNMRSRR